jgi:hypothetical protein
MCNFFSPALTDQSLRRNDGFDDQPRSKNRNRLRYSMTARPLSGWQTAGISPRVMTLSSLRRDAAAFLRVEAWVRDMWTQSEENTAIVSFHTSCLPLLGGFAQNDGEQLKFRTRVQRITQRLREFDSFPRRTPLTRNLNQDLRRSRTLFCRERV